MKLPPTPAGFVLLLCGALGALAAEKPAVPDWAWPGSATHQQVPPPAGFHRDTVVIDQPLGVFAGQADVGGPLLPGAASYDAATGRYTLESASYNIWYFRDEFRYAWQKLEGDVSLAADISFPNPAGYGDRKAVLVIRQDLDDNAKEVMTALHGAGLIHLALRPEKGADIHEACRVAGEPAKPGEAAIRLGIEKHGDTFTLYVGRAGGPMHAVAGTATLHFDGPFYVGIAFCSHVPDTVDAAVLSDVVLENRAGAVR